ncbi:hypothetical protein [Wolbachia endosymbiont of Litomosoides sigmodontis]|uniref:hypothetical protein n=1 Tax=Wolbachia endosymbiont of Litomosoides sigmodontis TaxID=80850 RepID=UPI00350ED5F0
MALKAKFLDKKVVELVKEMLKKVLNDPYMDKALKFEREEKLFTFPDTVEKLD